MPMLNSDVITPREQVQHDWDVDAWNKQAAHDLAKTKLQIEAKKLELQMRQEDAMKSRAHQEHMKDMEAEIRAYEAKWSQLLRLPILIVKLPLFILFGVAFIVAVAKGNEISQIDYWKLLR
jgi:hypothetical protein